MYVLLLSTVLFDIVQYYDLWSYVQLAAGSVCVYIFIYRERDRGVYIYIYIYIYSPVSDVCCFALGLTAHARGDLCMSWLWTEHLSCS